MTDLKSFAQEARRTLRRQVAARLEHVLRADSAELREYADAITDLHARIARTSKAAVIDEVAYTWFNRFIALRFMDVNGYNRVRVVSPIKGHTQPEILAEAKQGIIDDTLPVDHNRVINLLTGQLPADHPEQEAYRLLLVAACNARHADMPFMFEEIQDYTELLLPADLLSGNSILHAVRTTLTPDTCQNVEVIGWLYQYYISERKDEVMARKSAVPTEDIPAVTQLFTPHWIVRYLVENSLGRLWLLNHPDARLVEKMEYYIESSTPNGESAIKLTSPEAIRLCDPACGSGHMLTYAFDLLYEIYAEEGYDPIEIPRLILQKNLTGIEIDPRAGALAAFALTMKARAKDRRFLRRSVTPNICVLENITFTPTELNELETALGRDVLTDDLRPLLNDFEHATTFGALIEPNPTTLAALRKRLTETGAANTFFVSKLEKLLAQAETLTPRYDVVVANPPYMGSKGMNAVLKKFAKTRYPDSKSDTFAMFIERGFKLVRPGGYNAMVTMQSWMFLSSYEKLRAKLLDNDTILSMAHLANMVMGIAFGTAATIWQKAHHPNFKGQFSYVNYEDLNDDGIPFEFPVRNERLATASAADFRKIPGTSIAYWASKRVIDNFSTMPSLSSIMETREGLTTGSNDVFLRLWHEVEYKDIHFYAESNVDAMNKNLRWFPYVKGGEFRRWTGNYEYLVDWEKDGIRMRSFADPKTGRIRSHNYNGNYAFREGITWSGISSGMFAVRYVPVGFMFDAKGPMGFLIGGSDSTLFYLEAFLNSKVTKHFLEMLAPTLDFKLGHVLNLPYVRVYSNMLSENSVKNIQISQSDWDSYETSWDFRDLPLLRQDVRRATLAETYVALRQEWQAMTQDMQTLEEENNRIFIEAYGLQAELTPDVPLSEITLTCNPHYRYGGNLTDAQREDRLRADTIKEFISYAVGCMFGRYSLDKAGLVLANQGETIEDYRRQVPSPTFAPDDDNVIPILDEGWFADDITERFKEFLRVTFGREKYEENLAFIESALGKSVRKYFLKDFYKDHVKRYKKRPIYWLFASPKGSFNALIYMHRYRPDTVSVVLKYLRDFREKLIAHRARLEHISIHGTAREKTRALKDIARVDKMLSELRTYEDEILYPLATQQIAIDLDDGVKVNYAKFGKALKKI